MIPALCFTVKLLQSLKAADPIGIIIKKVILNTVESYMNKILPALTASSTSCEVESGTQAKISPI